MTAFIHETRARLSPKDRALLFSAAGGRCALCTRTIRAGERWDADHILPLAAGGDNDGNWQVLCCHCHGTKTRTDIATAAKIKRVATKHIVPSRLLRRSFATNRAGGWKRKIDGSLVRR
jgi:5-methylcytosine-specific restriction endonuclease McrA